MDFRKGEKHSTERFIHLPCFLRQSSRHDGHPRDHPSPRNLRRQRKRSNAYKSPKMSIPLGSENRYFPYMYQLGTKLMLTRESSCQDGIEVRHSGRGSTSSTSQKFHVLVQRFQSTSVRNLSPGSADDDKVENDKEKLEEDRNMGRKINSGRWKNEEKNSEKEANMERKS